MRSADLNRIFERVIGWTTSASLRRAVFWIMVLLFPVLAAATFAALGGMGSLAARNVLRLVLIVDFVYALLVAGFVTRRLAEMIAARRRRSAGSRLHLRLVRFFTAIALIPTILVAVFATISLNFGLEGWFSDRVRNVVSNSLDAAEAYEREHLVTLRADAADLARFLEEQKRRLPLMSGGELREYLTAGQRQMQRALPKAYVIDSSGALRARGERSYLFYYEEPAANELARAAEGEVVIIQDWEDNEFRALLRLSGFADHFLYVSREVDGEILSLLDETRETVRLYQQLENDRGSLIFEFALIYLGFAVVVILAAMWTGMWQAERLARPVGRLAGAAERVGRGDLGVRVRESDDDDEIALLGRTFNRMIGKLRGQRDDLIAAHDETERSRRLFDSVLSGVTAGVIGLDADGRIELVNASAAAMLHLAPGEAAGQDLAALAPEFDRLLSQTFVSRRGIAQGEVKLHRGDQERDLLVRSAARFTEAGVIEGVVISFDDVTDLVVAQRMAAWGDVARRIAHEVKNPLTPIQLSAERMRRKFGPMVGDKRPDLEQYVDVIVRQTNDLRRIVDEFSKFARMPAPDRRLQDIVRIVRDAVLLQETANPGIAYRLDLPEHSVLAQIDGTMIGQALTNLLKNAADAIREDCSEDAPDKSEIRIALTRADDSLLLDIRDNGPGLPEKATRLFEPYVTHRDKGTGLGLPIVKKIVEEHGGALELRAAEPFSPGARPGAWARIVLPHAAAEEDTVQPQQGGEPARPIRETQP